MKEEMTIASNPAFHQAWEGLQKKVGEVLSMCHTDIDNVATDKWHDTFNQVELALQKIHYLSAKIKK